MHSNWPEPDPFVIARFLKGDEEAFKTIYHSFIPGLLAYATTICGSREQAEDIVQDVFVSCWEKRAQIKEDKLGHWLVKVTRNMAVKAFRHNVLIAEYKAKTILEPDQAFSPLQIAGESPRNAQAMKIVDALPPARKKIFLLSRIDQKSYQEIADELGISVRTVEHQLSAALKHIRYQLSSTPTIISLFLFVNITVI